jgi:hypothetical protein
VLLDLGQQQVGRPQLLLGPAAWIWRLWNSPATLEHMLAEVASTFVVGDTAEVMEQEVRCSIRALKGLGLLVRE